MLNTDTFIINYDPLENCVCFEVHKNSGVVVGIADSEPLKDYENTDGLFSLEGQYKKIFDYIKENFDGQSEISLKINVTQLGFNKRQPEFERFKENVNRFNKTSAIKINTLIDITRLAPTQSDTSVEKGIIAEAFTSEKKAEEVTSATPKPVVKVAVVGKISSGKTELIAGLTRHNGSDYETSMSSQGTTKYTDSKNRVVWYEISGIEFGKENVIKAKERLEKLIEVDGVSIVLYCLNAKLGKIEDIERDFIVNVKQKYANIALYAVITSTIDDGASRLFANVISNATKQTKVFTVLAKEMRTNAGYLSSHGLDEITENIYGV